LNEPGASELPTEKTIPKSSSRITHRLTETDEFRVVIEPINSSASEIETILRSDSIPIDKLGLTESNEPDRIKIPTVDFPLAGKFWFCYDLVHPDAELNAVELVLIQYELERPECEPSQYVETDRING
jgi:hypothetical protein